MGINHSAFNGAVVFEMHLPTLRAERLFKQWLKAFEDAQLLPDGGGVGREHVDEATFCLLVSYTQRITVQAGADAAFDALREMVAKLENANPIDKESVKALWEARLDVHNAIMAEWDKAFGITKEILVNPDPVSKPASALAPEEAEEAARKDSPLVSPVKRG